MIREIRWFLTNYVLLLAVYFPMLLIWMVVALAAGWFEPAISSDASLADFAVGFGISVLVLFPLVVGMPLLAAGLAVWRVGRRITGHSRITAYGLAAVLLGFVAIRIPDADVLNVVVFVALPALVYATIVREPTRGRPAMPLNQPSFKTSASNA